MNSSYIYLRMSKDTLFTLDELISNLDNKDKDIVDICARVTGVMQTIIRHNRKLGLIPP